PIFAARRAVFSYPIRSIGAKDCYGLPWAHRCGVAIRRRDAGHCERSRDENLCAETKPDSRPAVEPNSRGRGVVTDAACTERVAATHEGAVAKRSSLGTEN